MIPMHVNGLIMSEIKALDGDLSSFEIEHPELGGKLIFNNYRHFKTLTQKEYTEFDIIDFVTLFELFTQYDKLSSNVHGDDELQIINLLSFNNNKQLVKLRKEYDMMIEIDAKK